MSSSSIQEVRNFIPKYQIVFLKEKVNLEVIFQFDFKESLKEFYNYPLSIILFIFIF